MGRYPYLSPFSSIGPEDRAAVRETLRGHPLVSSFRSGEQGEGDQRGDQRGAEHRRQGRRAAPQTHAMGPKRQQRAERQGHRDGQEDFRVGQERAAGGGPGGLPAAVAAARQGATVALIERYGFLGGQSVYGLVTQWEKRAFINNLGAVATHVIVQYLFDRPGFQQDPVPETARGAIIGAHCS